MADTASRDEPAREPSMLEVPRTHYQIREIRSNGITLTSRMHLHSSGREKKFAHLCMTSPSKIRPLLAAAPPSKTFATCNSWKSGGAGVKTTPMPACAPDCVVGAGSFSVTAPCVPWTVFTKSLLVGAAPAPRRSGEVEVRGAADSGGVGTGVAPESALSPRTSLTSGCEVKDSAAGSPPTGEPKGEAIL